MMNTADYSGVLIIAEMEKGSVHRVEIGRAHV